MRETSIKVKATAFERAGEHPGPFAVMLKIRPRLLFRGQFKPTSGGEGCSIGGVVVVVGVGSGVGAGVGGGGGIGAGVGWFAAITSLM